MGLDERPLRSYETLDLLRNRFEPGRRTDSLAGLDFACEVSRFQSDKRADLNRQLFGDLSTGLAQPISMEPRNGLLYPFRGLGRSGRRVFDSGETNGRVDLDDDRFTGVRQEIENESLEFDRVVSFRSNSAATLVEAGDFFHCPMKGQGLGVFSAASEKLQREDMHGDAARPEPERTVGLSLAGEPRGDIAVFDYLRAALKTDDVANFLAWVLLAHNLSGHIGMTEDVVTDQRRMADLEQGIIDLSIEKIANASCSHLLE